MSWQPRGAAPGGRGFAPGPYDDEWTPETSTAAELRRAARLMRERSQDAPGGVWSADGYGEVVSGRAEPDADDQLSSYYFDRAVCHVDDDDFPDEESADRAAQYIASWPPAVALAVADWLEVAVGATKVQHEAALAVARAYLGAEVPA